ncbi:hypothetical protein H5410_031116 [Solanum commersonii]|uniref:Uncharacterized protein n=1 Tax=Solanum commersonii TaxID=4109 RepID=A0A9J5YHH5_SOLCO|nr:hypothetical protein H5410_031116 [Solanum commersonii]
MVTAKTWELHLDWVTHNRKGRSHTIKIFRMIERNLRIFEKRSRYVESTVRDLVCNVRATNGSQLLVQELLF